MCESGKEVVSDEMVAAIKHLQARDKPAARSGRWRANEWRV